MTAEPRPVEEIRADLAIELPAPSCSCYTPGCARTRLAADVEPLLARLAAADRENADLRAVIAATATDVRAYVADRLADARRENAELRGEVERLRDLVARQLGDCIGCSPQTGPEETCPRDGRTYAEWVDIASTVIGRQHANDAERDDLRAQLAAAQAQLAEAQEAIDQSAEVMSSLGGAIVDAEARLEAVPCWDLGHAPCRFDKRPINASFHPDIEEEPLVMVDVDDEPPVSDEPARCVHGMTRPHETACYCPAPAPCEHDCPGPAASGTPDGGGS